MSDAKLKDGITQNDVDENFDNIKNEWDEMVSESGKSEAMFIATDNAGVVANFMAGYQITKTLVEAEGLIMPELVKGLEITIDD